MAIVRRPSPFGELLSLRQAMDRLFEDSVVRPVGWGSAGFDMGLPVDVSMTAEELVVEAQLPGIKPEDVDITVENGTLTIRVLTLRIPKADEVKPRQIRISPSTNGSSNGQRPNSSTAETSGQMAG